MASTAPKPSWQGAGEGVQTTLEKVATGAFVVAAIGAVLGEDTPIGFALTACGAVALGICVWLIIYHTRG